MNLVTRALACSVAFIVTASAGPVDFGLSELHAALVARKLNWKVKTELSLDPPETYRIEPYRLGGAHISGGDLRGLMYGLLEAAEQIRATGRLTQAHAVPATPMRGIRIFLHNADLERSWYFDENYWHAYFQMLARNRFNRFNLVFAHQTAYLAPPYPFLIDVEDHPEVRATGLAPGQRDRNLRMLRFISQTAADYGIDFTLGIWEHNIQPGMQPSVEGLTGANIGPYSHDALRKLLAACPMIRSVQMRTNSESGIPADQQVGFYRDYVFKALREAGRRVTLDLRGWVMPPGMLKAAEESGVPLRLSSKYWCEDLGRPYQPPETWSGYSYIDFLEKPRPYDFYWELWGLGSHRLLLWGDPEYVRRAVPTFTLSGSIGFEIDPPLAQKGFGNRPGEWSIFPQETHWEFQRYWLFYWLWGRLSYDPTTKLPKVDNLDEYRAASQVLNQIVAAHLADPNMYIWPEINPGGLIDAYKDVLPSDWRYIASIPEAVRNRLDKVPSAKQTALETATLLEATAARLDKTLTLDFQVLAHLARYHAHKQRAAYSLELFYQTADESSLDLAEQELKAALAVWESSVKITDSYPSEMAFGPDDIGHWKDKLPYVRHDLETIAQRRKVLHEFGRFLYGFDFGGRVEPPRVHSYRHDPYVDRNTLEPRFLPIDPATKFSDALSYGWLTDGDRTAVELPLTPYDEVRATVPNPTHLPGDVLHGDSIRGHGAQIFRVKTQPGDFVVEWIPPDGPAQKQTLSSRDGFLDIPFPEGDWNIAALVIHDNDVPPAIPPLPRSIPRPQFAHTPTKAAPPDEPLNVTLQITPPKDVHSVRLYYRPLNQLAQFKMIEKPAAASITFTIPADDIPANWDLLYYFEILNRENSGWFEPDPLVATPYHVVRISNEPSSDHIAAVPEAARSK